MARQSFRWCILQSPTPSGSLPVRRHTLSASWKKEFTERLQGPLQTHTLSHSLSLRYETKCWNTWISSQENKKMCFNSLLVSSVAVSHTSQPRSLIANLLGGPSTLASIHFCRDSSLTSHTAADGASALRSLSPLTNSAQLRGNLNVAHRPAGHNLAMSKTMTGSG